MNNIKLKKDLINKDKYQVFLCVCPANLLFSFAIHPWFVINHKGTVSRWEVLFPRRKHNLRFGYLNKNFYSLFQGIEILPFSQKYFWKGKILSKIEGDENSVAAQMIDFIEKSNQNYPYTEKYCLIGPNSNTYIQWVLNYFPQSNMVLPWNAIGKNKARKLK
ncbi:MAG: DUF3750 domain-containing protein [Candidatus Pacebacteria bacterium]|nr:DUF3750 domain-containing protein [Candidatus Paceibacterota bacterium]